MRQLSKGWEDLSKVSKESFSPMAWVNCLWEICSTEGQIKPGLRKTSSLKSLATPVVNFQGPQVSLTFWKSHKTVADNHLVVIPIYQPTFYRYLNCGGTKVCRQAKLKVLAKFHIAISFPCRQMTSWLFTYQLNLPTGKTGPEEFQG